MDIALAALNYSRICHIYNVYSGINRGINKKEGAIVGYFVRRQMWLISGVLQGGFPLPLIRSSTRSST